ncbi:hypothetical protein BASA83_000019 [Batrachochytrium salamandrivorans]|nr:hypothetical protein BASA83_000019 [Batrachochytrium salamandrivorans]
MHARRRLLGEYNLGRTIGQGAFSKVKIASHRETGEKAAIKVIDKKLMEEKAKKSKSSHEERERKRIVEEFRRARADMQVIVNVPANDFANLVSTVSRADTPEKGVPNNTIATTDSGKRENPTCGSESSKSPSITPVALLPQSEEAAVPSVKPDKPPSFISTLQKEVQLMMRLDHPNIIKVFQVLETDEECFIVMEYAKGGELISYIAARDHLTEKEARKFFRQILSALDHCHLASVVHRDLKLENLLLDQERNVLISDFGLGRTFNPNAEEYMKTFCGTPNYAAVELVSGIPYVGVKSDIWAMGVVLYVMMCGRAPFVGQTISLLYRHIKAVEYKIPDYFSNVRDPAERIDMDGIRSHPWVNYECIERPLRIFPAMSGAVDTAALAQSICSIYYDKTFVVYVFRRHIPEKKISLFAKTINGVKTGNLSIVTSSPATHMRRSSLHNDTSKEQYVRRKSISFGNTTGSPSSPIITKSLGLNDNVNHQSLDERATVMAPKDISLSTTAGLLLPGYASTTKNPSLTEHRQSDSTTNQVSNSQFGNSLSKVQHPESDDAFKETPLASTSMNKDVFISPMQPKRARRMSLQDTLRIRPLVNTNPPHDADMCGLSSPLSPSLDKSMSSALQSPTTPEEAGVGGSGLDSLQESKLEDHSDGKDQEEAPKQPGRPVRTVGRGRPLASNLLEASTTTPLNDSQSNMLLNSSTNSSTSQVLSSEKSLSVSRSSFFNRRRSSASQASPLQSTTLMAGSVASPAILRQSNGQMCSLGHSNGNEEDRANVIMRRMSAVSPMVDDVALKPLSNDQSIKPVSTPSEIHTALPVAVRVTGNLRDKFSRKGSLTPVTINEDGIVSQSGEEHELDPDSTTAQQPASMTLHSSEEGESQTTNVPIPKPLKEINLSMQEIEEWHTMHKPPKEVRTMRFSFSKATTSEILSPASMFQDLHKALIAIGHMYNDQLKFTRTPNYYLFHCEYCDKQYPDMSLEFEIEVCKVWLLNLHGMRMKRLAGNVFLFKEIYSHIIAEVHWDMG